MSDGMVPDDSKPGNFWETLLSGRANSVQGVKFAAKRSRHSARFGDRIQKNAESVDQLISVIKELTRQPDTADQVEKLIDIAKDLLDNNAKLREQVEEALQDIPD